MASKSSSPSNSVDDVELDHEGNIRCEQPRRSPPPRQDDQPDENRLTSENFALVKQHSDPVRNLIISRDSVSRFAENNLRFLEQGIRPRWLGRPVNIPVLPASAAFPAEFHESWNRTVQKYETKLQRKVNKYLPDIIDSLHSSISKTRTNELKAMKELILETRPGQGKRSEILFYRLCNRTERVPLPGHRSRRARSSSTASPQQDI